MSRTDILETLVQTGIALSETDNTQELLDLITSKALELGSCEGVSIYAARGKVLQFVASRNLILEAINRIPPFRSFELPIDGSTIAGYCAASKKILNIPDVYKIPKSSSFAFNSSFDDLTGYKSQSMLVLPMCDTKGHVLGVLQLINHSLNGSRQCFPTWLEHYMKALASQVGIIMRNTRFSEELKLSRIEAVKAFVKASEFHDQDTGGHIERMSRYCYLLYKRLGYDEEACETIRLASMLHDVGKVAIPDAILKKPGRLTPEERLVMNTHAECGWKMLRESPSPALQMGALIAWSHHERWDGTGYPKGLKGEDIPLEARITTLADVFDALCSRRCYKDPWPLEKVLQTLREDSGTHFDPRLVELFFENLGEVLGVLEKFPPAGYEDAVQEQLVINRAA